VSRLVVFGLNNSPVGDFVADCNRGWILLGNTGVADGGQTTVRVPESVAAQPWLQLGRLVLVERPPLPAWLGVIDTPWKAMLPVELTLYNAEYLFSLRQAERSAYINGPLSAAIGEAIRIVNEQEQTFISLGNSNQQQESFEKVIEQGAIWDQVIKFLEDSGYEMILRPQRDVDNHLAIYADVGTVLGSNTGYLLHDGETGNMTVIDAAVNGTIINRVKAVSGQSTEEAQLETDVFENQSSQDAWRTRSEVLQFQNVTQLSTLNQYAQNYLSVASRPYLDLTVQVEDRDNAFAHMRVGNYLLAHASNVYLPGGIHGWRGMSRILAMAYDERNNTVRTTLRGLL
jgi:hypothetical protein